jgi:hypothetical protein
MKRILTLLFLSIIALGSRAQVLFTQDFESGVLDPMFAVDVDGKTVNPGVAQVAGPTFQVVQQTATNKSVVSTSWFDPVGQADDWLISPPITITDANTFLVWRAYSPDASFRDGYQVRISTTDSAIASFTNLALNVAQELTTWTQRSVKLTNYVGQTIYFAFRNNSTDKYLLFMDDIKVEVLKNNNAIVRNLTFDKYNPLTTEVPVKINVENHGAVQLTSFLFDYTIGGNTYTDTVSNLNIAPLKAADVTHSITYVIDEVGEFPLSVKISNPNGTADEDTTNNEITRYIYGLETPVNKKVLVEEATGTWCQWCPRGAVNMDLIVEKYPDLVMPVAVHNSDPMTIPDYDSPMGATIGGYPSGHVDRTARDIDPLDFETNVLALQDRLVPAEVTTNVTWDPDTRTATIHGTAHLTIPTQANALRFNCIITESNVTGEDSGYDQVNAYSGGGAGVMGGFEELPNPVPYEQMVYDFVARAILGTFDGLESSVPDEVAAGEDFDFEFSYTVPDEYDVNEMKAIILVQDEENGQILNGDIQNLGETTSVPAIPVGHFSAYPNPTTDVLNLNVDYKTDAKVTMKIYTPMGQLVRDLGNLDLTNGNQTTQIRVADLSSGNYILELRNNNSVSALPFTKM